MENIMYSVWGILKMRYLWVFQNGSKLDYLGVSRSRDFGTRKIQDLGVVGMQAAGEAMGMTESPLENVQAEGKKSPTFMVRWRKALWVKLARGHKKVGHEN